MDIFDYTLEGFAGLRPEIEVELLSANPGQLSGHNEMFQGTWMKPKN